jgi:hypothetical protein
MSRLGAVNIVEVGSDLYSTSYHPVRRDDRPTLDIWQEPLAVGSALPTMPLFLKGGTMVPVDLQRSYESTLTALRI